MPRLILLVIVASVSFTLFTACYSKPPAEQEHAAVVALS